MSYNVIHDNFRVFNLQKFIDSLNVSLGDNKLYLGIGRPQVWPGTTDSEPRPTNMIDTRNSDWEDVCSLQRITYADVCTGIVRETWKANTKYDQYRHDWGKLNVSNTPERQSVYYSSAVYPASLSEAKYYVINSDDDVFICIKQSKDINGNILPSTFEPGYTSNGVYLSPVVGGAGIFKGNDGYYWKYIANVMADSDKFRTNGYDAIRTLVDAPSPTSPTYSQWMSQVNSANYKQGIYCIDVLSKGSGYNGGSAGTTDQTDLSFKVVGNGTGLQFNVVYGAGGTIENVEITNPGSGYSFAEIQTTGGSGANFDIIFTAQSGLGTNPIKDLSGLYLLINTKLEGDTGGLMIGNDYRKVVLVSNPKVYNSSVDATAAQLSAMTTLTIAAGHTGASAFVKDQIISGSATNAKGYVVQWDDTISELKVIKNRDLYTAGIDYDKAHLSLTTADTVSQNVGGAIGISSITAPSVQPFSGDILYSEYRPAINRDSQITEDISIIVQF